LYESGNIRVFEGDEDASCLRLQDEQPAIHCSASLWLMHVVAS